MATSIYVYQTMGDFLKVYGDKIYAKEFCTDILDMYIAEGEKLWVVTDVTKEVARPELNRTIVHFYANDVNNYLTGKEKLILYEKISFNPKKGRIEFFSRKFKEPELFFRIGRYYGDELKKNTKINYKHRFYDFTTNRMNFIIE